LEITFTEGKMVILKNYIHVVKNYGAAGRKGLQLWRWKAELDLSPNHVTC